MLPISRRNLLRGAAGASTLPFLGPGPAVATTSADVPPPRQVGAGPFTYVYDPSIPAGPRYLNDHTLIRTQDRWHLFGIVGNSAPRGESPDSAAEIPFAHASAPSPLGPWTGHPDVLTVAPSYFGEEHLWAPHVVEAGGRFWMFYAAGGASGAAINLATSTDLFTWTREPSGPLFRGLAARDPMVLRLGGEWVMYYTELSGPVGHHIVAYRRSADLLHWSEPGTAFTDASTDATVSVTESPYVVERDGWSAAAPALAVNADGRLEAFSLTPGGARLGHRRQVAPGGDTHSGAEFGEPGIRLVATPTAALDAAGRLHVFAVTVAGRIRTRVQSRPSGGWQPWTAFGDRMVATLVSGSPALWAERADPAM